MPKTFAEFDKYELKPFADTLTDYLQVESKFVDESFVLSLNSEFGSGKSTFFEMWSNELITVGNIFKVVHINAWESDFQGDPLLAIISSLLIQIKPSGDGEAETIKETAGKLGKFSLAIGNDVVQKFTGIDFIKAGKYAEPGNEIAKEKSGHACFELYQDRCRLFYDLKTQLRTFTEKSELPILIITDELDRCRPNYAIEFLETIKHFFDTQGLIFVIGVDKGQLASSAKCLFGQDLEFDEYYRKFAHRNVNLPVKSQPATEGFCRKIVEEYLSEEAFTKKNRFSYAKHDSYRTGEIVQICTAFSLNARQIHELLRISAHAFSITENKGSQLIWGWQLGTFFMIALSIKNHDLYDQIGRKTMSLSEYTDFLRNLSLVFNNDQYEPFIWAALLYLGVFCDQPMEKLEKQFATLGVWDSTGKNDGAFGEQLRRYANAYFSFGRGGKPVFPKIYTKLEELRTFAE